MVDATTIGPTDAMPIAELRASRTGSRYVDAPLFGSIEPAEAGTLATYVGGRRGRRRCRAPGAGVLVRPAKVVHAGPVGAGASVKIVRNMGHGIATAAIGECLRLAADLGIPRELALSTVANGPFTWTYNWRKDRVRHAATTPRSSSAST